MSDGDRILHLYEKLGAMEQTIKSAHSRVDELRDTMKSDIVEIKGDVKKLMTAEHKRTGWIAGIVFVVMAAGELLKFLFMTKGGH